MLLAPLYAAIAALVPLDMTRSVALALASRRLGAALHLPFSIVKTFGLEAQFGFNRTTP